MSWTSKPSQNRAACLWRGSLLPLGCEAALNALIQADRILLVYDGFAAEREQAPSPQLRSRSPQITPENQ
jgi:hypothetical protein